MEQEGQLQEEGAGPVVSFLKGKHELARLLKSLDKASQAAVDLLIRTMENSEDEKLRAACAKDLLTFYAAVSKQISDDDMARLVAEVKLGGGRGRTLKLTPGEPEKPALNFDEIREV
jgi:hypothetical protein